jgi:PPOX class probable F420-dependent enzyme
MVDFNSAFGARVLKRLQEESIIWLTTVAPSGTPQPNPVWFYWDGETVLIYSKPDANKVRNINTNPKVSLNFEGAAEDGGEVIVLTGEILTLENTNKIDPAYERKYHQLIIDFGETAESLAASYSAAIRVKPLKFRGF